MEVKAKEILRKFRADELSIKDIDDDPLGVFLMLPFINNSTKFTKEEISKAFDTPHKGMNNLLGEYSKGPDHFCNWLQSGAKDLDVAMSICFFIMIAEGVIRTTPVDKLAKQLLRGSQ